MCLEKGQNTVALLMERVKDLKDVVLRTEMDRKALESQVSVLSERRKEAEEKMARVEQDNEELKRRVETIRNGDGEVVENEEAGVEGDAVDVDQVKYGERMAYSLEHYGKITQLAVLDGAYLHSGEEFAHYFASGDSLGAVKVWDLDKKDPLFSLLFQEDRFSSFTLDVPPAVRDLVQVNHKLFVAMGHDHQPGII